MSNTLLVTPVGLDCYVPLGFLFFIFHVQLTSLMIEIGPIK